MKRKVAIIGGGTSSLFLAAFLDTAIYDVCIYEKKKALGRKFLVAGDGGFNLTHGEDFASFKSRYTPEPFLEKALAHFTNSDLRAWLSDIDIPTFVGSSGRVFPEKQIKPIAVLKSIEDHLVKNNIKFEFNKIFTGWVEKNGLLFNSNETIEADYVVFTLGGASWKVTGSDGAWLPLFKDNGITTVPFQSSNCAFKIDWPERLLQRYEGKPLKNISISLNGKTQKGEAVITKFGIEGNAIYGLSPEIQTSLASKNKALIHIDFKPTTELPTLIKKITESKSNITTTLKEVVKLPLAAVELIKSSLTKEEYLDVSVLAKFIKFFPLIITGSAPIDEAISTSGGISLSAVDSNFELIQLKNNFCIGEMLDWDAPTGGYLIQACASMGVYLADHLNTK